MKIIRFSELDNNPRQQLSGARWLILHHSEVEKATSILMFTELDGILVAVDHRGKEIVDGLWQRYINFPSAKQIIREVSGRTYAEPVNLKQYYGAR